MGNDELFSYIQYHLRKECLALGAGLCYTSAKAGLNQEVLCQEILYNIGFAQSKSNASVIDRASINIPLGWDSLKKIELLKESLLNIDINDTWTNVVTNVHVNLKSGTGQETVGNVATLDELHQSFLQNLQQTLAKNNANNQNAATPSGKDNTPLDRTVENSSPTQFQVQQGSAVAAANATQGQGAGSDRALADFFQQLLKKSSGQPAGSQPGSPGQPQANTAATPTASPSASRTASSQRALQSSPLANMLNKNK